MNSAQKSCTVSAVDVSSHVSFSRVPMFNISKLEILNMPTVTNAFARAMAEAAGMTLTDDGALCSNGAVVFRVPRPVDGQIADADYLILSTGFAPLILMRFHW